MTDTTITETGLMGSLTIEIEDAIRIVWRTVPRSVVVRSSGARIKIDLDKYTPIERDELITSCRTLFRQEIQEGWPRFVERFLEPSPKRERRARVAASGLLVLLTFFAGSFVYFWFIGLGVQHLVVGMVNALVVLYYLWSLRVRSWRVTNTSLSGDQRAEITHKQRCITNGETHDSRTLAADLR